MSAKSLSLLLLVLLILPIASTTPPGMSKIAANSSPIIAFTPPKVGPDGGYYYVGAQVTDSNSYSNHGLRAKLQVEDFDVSTFSLWTAEEMGQHDLWAQVGWFGSNSGPYAFVEIWNLSSYSIVNEVYRHVSVGTHIFTMKEKSPGSTIWIFMVGNKKFASYNMQSTTSDASSGYPIYTLSEEGYVNGPYNPPQFNVPIAIQYSNSGSWQYSAQAYVYGSNWGVVGNLQNSNIQLDAMLIGGNNPVSSGELWNGVR